MSFQLVMPRIFMQVSQLDGVCRCRFIFLFNLLPMGVTTRIFVPRVWCPDMSRKGNPIHTLCQNTVKFFNFLAIMLRNL